MNSYQLYEGNIQIPDGWKDQTMNAFMLPESNGKGGKASFVVSRDYDTKSETIEHYADLQRNFSYRRNINRSVILDSNRTGY